jgi:hypothetical protein
VSGITAPKNRTDRIAHATGKTGYVRSLADGQTYEIVSNRRTAQVRVRNLAGQTLDFGRATIIDVPAPTHSVENDIMAARKSAGTSKSTKKPTSSKKPTTKKLAARGSAATKGKGKKPVVDEDDEDEEDDVVAVKPTPKGKGKAKPKPVVVEDDDEDDDVVDDDEDDDGTDEEDEADDEDEEDDEEGDEDDEDDEDDEEDDDDEPVVLKAKGAKAGTPKGKGKVVSTPAATPAAPVDERLAISKEIVGLIKETNASIRELTSLLTSAAKVSPTVAAPAASAKACVADAPAPKAKKITWIEVTSPKDVAKGDAVRFNLDGTNVAPWLTGTVSKINAKTVYVDFKNDDDEDDEATFDVKTEYLFRKA